MESFGKKEFLVGSETEKNRLSAEEMNKAQDDKPETPEYGEKDEAGNLTQKGLRRRSEEMERERKDWS